MSDYDRTRIEAWIQDKISIPSETVKFYCKWMLKLIDEQAKRINDLCVELGNADIEIKRLKLEQSVRKCVQSPCV